MSHLKRHSQETKDKISKSRIGKCLGNKNGFVKGHNRTEKKRIQKRCLICQKDFEVVISVDKKGKGKFCSKRCHIKSQIGGISPKKGRNDIQRNCLQCDKLFITKSGKVKFGGGKLCSIVCRTKYQKGRKLSEEHRQKLKGRKHTEEAKRKIGEAHKGDKNYQWITDRTKTIESRRIRRSIEFRLWREAVFARDNWTCQKCKERGVNLHPHHIRNFAEEKELRFAIDNGITFCKECHIKFHHIYGRKNNNQEQINEFLII